MGPYVALYLRISRDKSGRVEGVARQETWGRDYANRAWPNLPVRVFADNNLSADEDTHRPEYELLRKAIRAGEVAQLWTVEQSRITRVEIHWFELAADLIDIGVNEIHTDRDGIVRLDEVAGIKAVLAAAERRRLQRRVTDTLSSLAAEGRPTGGPVFGYKRTVDAEGRKALEVIPELADAIRHAAELVLLGWSLSAVAREMEARGIPTRLGGRWSHSNVKGMLTAPVVAGKRVHRGEVVRDGNWEPILDEVTWSRLCNMLGGRRDVTHPDGTVQHVGGGRRLARRYLLTGGTACCGRCGAALVARRRRNHQQEPVPIYFCDKDHQGCGRLGVIAGDPLPDGDPGLESAVVTALLEHLQSAAFLALLEHDDTTERRDTLTRRLREVTDRRARLARTWAQGNLTDIDWDEARAELDIVRQGLEHELAQLVPVGNVDPDAVTEGWVHMDLHERRQVIDMCIKRVVVAPATPGAKRFDPGRVSIEWR